MYFKNANAFEMVALTYFFASIIYTNGFVFLPRNTLSSTIKLHESSTDMFDPEEASKRGAQRIASMSIEERTRRAMLGEATEDRMIVLMDELEKVIKVEKLDDEDTQETIKNLSMQIKNLQDDYNTIVSGEPFPLLGDIEKRDDKIN